MLCERCKKNDATVFYKESINGKKKSYSLCEDCAAELEASGKINLHEPDLLNMFTPGFGFGESILDGLFAPVSAYKPYLEQSDEKKCRLCGSSFDDLVREGKAICPECYDTFDDELSETISRLHGSATHRGHMPKRLRVESDKKNEVKSLQCELKEAIKNEEYEKAAELRDKIKELNSDAE